MKAEKFAWPEPVSTDKGLGSLNVMVPSAVLVAAAEAPLWVEYVVAFGTAGAAIFAGWAALTARASTKATRNLVKLEAARDQAAREEAEWRQARRITVDLVGRKVDLPEGRGASDFQAVVLNGSADPIRKCRLKVVDGNERWGPQLIGTIPAGGRVRVMTRTYDGPGDNPDAHVRFIDVAGRYWVASARLPLHQDDATSTSRWIAEGAEMASRTLNPEERGAIDGILSEPPDFNHWLAELGVLEATTSEQLPNQEDP